MGIKSPLNLVNRYTADIQIYQYYEIDGSYILRVILCATSPSHLPSGDSINLVVANGSCSRCQ